MPAGSSGEFPEVIASADLFLSTMQKSLLCPVVPSKLLGYMAARRPIVRSFPDGGDAPRVVRDASCGVCVPPAEPKQLPMPIIDASMSPEKGRVRGQNGRRFVETHHNRDVVMALYESILEQLL